MPNEHAFISPSDLSNLELCPGKAWAEKGYERRSSPAAIDGTHSHTSRQWILEEDAFDYSDDALLGMELSDHEGSFIVDQARLDRVKQSILNVKKLMPDDGHYALFVELQVPTGQWFDCDDHWGTCDTIMDTDNFVLIDDFKDGGEPVYPDGNLQLADYALGYAYGKTFKDDFPFWLSINQPKHRQDLKIWATTYGELTKVYLPRIEGIVKASLDPTAPRIPGEKQCRWCLHRSNCKERASEMNDAVQSLTRSIPSPAIPVDGPFRLPEITTSMCNEDISTMLDYEDLVVGWFKDLRKEALRRALAGDVIPRHKVVRSSKRRKYIDDHEKIKKALAGMKLKKKDYLEEKLVSFTKLLNHSDLTERQKARIEKELIVKPQGDYVLVPESDNRKAIEMNPQKQLQDIPAGDGGDSKPVISFL